MIDIQFLWFSCYVLFTLTLTWHVLKPETTKRNHRNEMTETSETTETKPPKRNHRNHRNDRNDRNDYLFQSFRFARFDGFGRFVSLVSLVSFRWFRFVVSGFSTCPLTFLPVEIPRSLFRLYLVIVRHIKYWNKSRLGKFGWNATTDITVCEKCFIWTTF